MGTLLLCLAACNQNHQQKSVERRDSLKTDQSMEEASLIQIGEGRSADGKLIASLYATDSLVDTYQDLYIKLKTEEGNVIQKAVVQVMPEMKMGRMAHGAPVIQPSTESHRGFFTAGVVFIMPTSVESDHNWTVNLLAGQAQATQNRVSIPVKVKQAKKPRTIAFDAGTEGRFFLSLLEPAPFKMGEQSVRFVLHRINKNEFPAVLDGYEIALNTHMPDMGHGSEGNQNALAGNGDYYTGKLNFSMPGLWEVQVNLLKAGQKVSTEPIVFSIQIK